MYTRVLGISFLMYKEYKTIVTLFDIYAAGQN